MGRVLASTQNGLVRQLRSMRSTATSALIGILGSIATPPHRDGRRAWGSSHTTNFSPEANMVEVGNDEAFVTLLATGTVPQLCINGVPKWTCREVSVSF